MQVCMAHGVADGWVEYDGEVFQLRSVPAYTEKNWGECSLTFTIALALALKTIL